MVTFQTAERPSQPAAVATELSNLSVRISWFLPTDNGKTIESYRVVIQDSNEDGTFIEDTENCDGSNALILGQRYCDIPVKSSLRQAPYGLMQGQTVIA